MISAIGHRYRNRGEAVPIPLTLGLGLVMYLGTFSHQSVLNLAVHRKLVRHKCEHRGSNKAIFKAK